MIIEMTPMVSISKTEFEARIKQVELDTATAILNRIEAYICFRNEYVKEYIDKSGFATEVYYDGRIDSYSELLDFISNVKKDCGVKDKD